MSNSDMILRINNINKNAQTYNNVILCNGRFDTVYCDIEELVTAMRGLIMVCGQCN